MSVTESLDQRADRLLAEAQRAFDGHEWAEAWLGHHRQRLAEPLRLAVAGPRRSGKSTLVNALLGDDVAPVRVEGSAPLVWFHDGPAPVAEVFPGWDAPYAVPLLRAEGAAGHVLPAPATDTGADQVVVEWPCRALRHTRLLDTPALRPDADGEQASAYHFTQADALLYVTRHVAESDLRLLQPVRSGRGAAVHPVPAMVVLSRADEAGGGRPDALLTAKQIARRRRRDPRLAAVCQDVLAVSPLVASAARTLREDEYTAIAALAGLSRAESEPHLLSTDRFTRADFPAAIPVAWRAALLDRFGLGGVRLATTLVRTGSTSRTALADQLLRHSGLAELQASIADLFTRRRTTLKARTALVALDHLLRTEPRPWTAQLAGELERLIASAHEFRELRLLAALRTGRVTLPPDLAVEARRLAGGDGTTAAERLGLPGQASPAELWPAAQDAVDRWQQQIHTAAGAAAQRAAHVVLRSCAAILAGL